VELAVRPQHLQKDKMLLLILAEAVEVTAIFTVATLEEMADRE
jgi:hypothetical protein